MAHFSPVAVCYHRIQVAFKPLPPFEGNLQQELLKLRSGNLVGWQVHRGLGQVHKVSGGMEVGKAQCWLGYPWLAEQLELHT